MLQSNEQIKNARETKWDTFLGEVCRGLWMEQGAHSRPLYSWLCSPHPSGQHLAGTLPGFLGWGDEVSALSHIPYPELAEDACSS